MMDIVERALAELDGSDFEAVRDHSATLRATIQSLQADNAALREGLVACLAHEANLAKARGYSDCTCINYSRESERAYETGNCPHQKARALIGKEQS